MAYSTTSSSVVEDPRINEILQYWFEKTPQDNWFMPSAEDGQAMDDYIRSTYGQLVEQARETDELDDMWTQTPRGALALVILLDQFPRNIYRGSHLSYAADNKAHRITTTAIANEFDTEVASQHGGNLHMRAFFYLPLMHAEDLISQVACVSLCENLKKDYMATGPVDPEGDRMLFGMTEFAKKHLKCIQALGRFPLRNQPLQREHREEDKQWLEEHPTGF